MRHLAIIFGLLLVPKMDGFEFVIEGDSEGDSPATNSAEDLSVHQYMKFRRSVLPSEEEEEAEEDFEAIAGVAPVTVQSYKVESRITSRFAHTTVKSSVVNSAPQAQSIAFNVQIPKRAFINNFTMNVNGITFVGSVKEKTVARNLYAQARARGKAAGIVRSNSLDMETFKTEVHVPAGSKIEFELHYQEMMQRKLGVYEHSLHLQPGRLVPQLQVDVYIYEPKGISFVEAPNTLGEQFSELTKITKTKDKAHVVFKPTLQQQKKCWNCTTSAVEGVFTVKYDVERDNNAGELQVSDGHFVQFFAPSNLAPLPKNIVFVIDVSGSMWGLKMKQTVEAMKTILDDLSLDDYFSIIDFNHNVRCWSEDLVAGSSIQRDEAKQYIQNIKPSGGTNINEAILRAIHILTKASNLGLIDPRSVSMILLVSDGDPTVGEIKLSAIQKNIKRNMREEFSLFSLGIGFDVDYDFLERIALENRGIAQRVYANQDAAQQLQNFYSQVSSPLLRKISIQFPEDTVTDLTQNEFDKFFSGSELVVAGKIQQAGITTLHSFTTASSSRMDLSLQTEADCFKLDGLLTHQTHSFAGFARQMWAYITINQLLAERSLAPTAAKKRKITQRILGLAVEHQFVTPFTALLVESEGGLERVLAESPKDRKQGCCVGTAPLGGKTPVQVVHSVPPWAQTPTDAPPSEVEGPVPDIVNLVDNDPHFIVHLPKSNMDICFNIDSEPGHILNLVSDPESGVTVNGQLIGAKQMVDKKLSTYFGAISVSYKPEGIRVDATPENIVLTDGKGSHNLSWAATADASLSRVKVSIVKDSQMTVTVNDEISVMVLLHRVWKKNPVGVDFLGLYIPNTNKYSPTVHGLIGQFSIEPEVKVYNFHEGADPLKIEATMEVKGNKLAVTRGWQKDYRKDKKRGSDVFCWFIHNSGKGFIEGHYKDYLVPQLDSFYQQQ
ncbi:inter-alpha-trypsin inhibitor heavy chain H2 [Anguilla anguilla]|uniref:inter-alpha-trypsin inhibitor heavy chain H2 n=1 Tax=Anguilla anguilla TaxID=7936 RepID=UPI0015ADAE22|nr:inter-alpha-trypsin inhibitor heavy chain H2 [Anguilla anguilla]